MVVGGGERVHVTYSNGCASIDMMQVALSVMGAHHAHAPLEAQSHIEENPILRHRHLVQCEAVVVMAWWALVAHRERAPG